MKVKYYGTCAAEGFPGIYCSCKTCERARELGGRNIRTRSQATVNDELVIDFSADTYLHILNYGLDLRKAKAVLITHGHDDHCYPYDILYRIYGYAYVPDEAAKKALPVYSTRKSGEKIRSLYAVEMVEERDKNAIDINTINVFEPFSAAGYKVTPLKANHDYTLEPVIYIIEKDGKSILWGHDTGYFCPETWEYIEKSGIRFDFVSLDCTQAMDGVTYNWHMCVKACCDVKDRLLKNNNADDNTIFVLNHFSHNGGIVYDDLVPIAKDLGFLVSYDGFEVEF